MSRVTKKSLEDVEAGDWVYETNPDTRSHPEMSAPPYTESFEMFVEVPVLSADEKTITTENGTYKRRNGRVVAGYAAAIYRAGQVRTLPLTVTVPLGHKDMVRADSRGLLETSEEKQREAREALAASQGRYLLPPTLYERLSDTPESLESVLETLRASASALEDTEKDWAGEQNLDREAFKKALTAALFFLADPPADAGEVAKVLGVLGMLETMRETAFYAGVYGDYR